MLTAYPTSYYDRFIYNDIFPRHVLPAFSLRTMYKETENVDPIAQRRKLVDRIAGNSAQVVGSKQVHGVTILAANENGFHDGFDAFVTEKQGLFITVAAADCLPIYFSDIEGKVVALGHAGWRGTHQEIASKITNLLVSKHQVKAENLVVLMGPCISETVYEVGPEVADNFPEEALIRGKTDRSFLSLKKANYIQLLKAGLRDKQIFSDKHCTYLNPALFHSWRRDGESAGRMIAAIGKYGE